MPTASAPPSGTCTGTFIAGSGTETNDGTINLNADDGQKVSMQTTTKNTNWELLSGGVTGLASQIPADATIDQVQVEYQNDGTTGGTQFVTIQRAGTNGTEESNLTGAETVRTTAALARPGGGSWTRDDLADNNLKIRFRALQPNNTTSRTYSWDYGKVIVTYTEAGGRTAPSAPTLVATATAGTGDRTTGSFTPSASALLVVVTWGDSPPSTASDITVSDSLGGSWTEILLENFADGQPGVLKAAWQTTGASPAARTVTLAHSEGAGAASNHGGWVYELTSVDLASPVGAAAGNRGDGTVADPVTVAVTTQFVNSLVMGGMSNYNTTTAGAGTATTLLDAQSVTGFSGGAAVKASSVTASPSAVTLSVNRSPTQDVWHTLAFEVKGTPAAAAVPPLFVSQYAGRW